MKYDLVALIKQKRPRMRAILPPIEERLTTTRLYQAALRKMLQAVINETRDAIIPSYRPERLTRDADSSTFTRLRQLTAALSATATQTVEGILGLEASRHTETFKSQVRRVAGVDISAVVSQEDLTEYLRQAAARNASLITSLGDDVLKRVEQTVLNASINGASVKSLKGLLVEQFGIVGRRADIIARDQTAKMVSDLNRIRQEQAGITTYSWATSQDERVRPLHKTLDGKVYEWGKPTGAEGGAPPGQPVLCRCVARAIIDFGDGRAFTGGKPAPGAPTAAPVRRPRAARPDPGQPVNVAPTPLLPPAETLEARNTRLDVEQRDYVLTEGRAAGVEYLTAVDLVTGTVFGRNVGVKAHVGFTPEFAAAIADPKRSIVAHHNHPSSGSFSKQDLIVTGQSPGLKGLWAHGHDGSSYYVERGRFAMTEANVKRLEVDLLRAMRVEATMLRITVPDLNLIYWHVLSLALDRKKRAVYRYELSPERQAAVDRNAAVIADILDKL